MPTILGANTLSSGYDVANSLRLNSGDSAQMNKTLGTATDVDKYTISMWVKRSRLGHRQMMMRVINPSSTGTYAFLEFQADDKLNSNDYDESGSIAKTTNAQFRDPNAWMHIVLALDSTQGTASNRSKLYVNGTQITDFGTDSGGSQNQNLMGNTSGKTIYIGGDGGQDTRYCGLYMAEVCFIDGQQLDPTSFGEFDSDTPTIWKPIDVSGLTFGNNGFYLDFEDSSNLGNDVNGGTDLTEVNLAATDQSTDTCTNNFATLNPLRYDIHTLAEGNLQYTAASSAWKGVFSTIGVSTGKFYCEVKYSSLDGSTWRFYTGIADARDFNTVHKVGQNESGRVGDTIGILPDGSSTDVIKNGSDAGGTWSNFSVNDILGMAIDCDNGALYFSRNGVWENSSNPESGASKTGAITFTVGETYLFGFGTYGTSSPQQQVNFGSPIHSISSGNSDANGHGNFEYAVPSGYYSLNTKNLAEFG